MPNAIRRLLRLGTRVPRARDPDRLHDRDDILALLRENAGHLDMALLREYAQLLGQEALFDGLLHAGRSC